MVLRGIHAVVWARVVDSAFGAVGLVIIARALTHEDFGYFSYFVSAAILAQEFTGEGLEAALVRFRQPGASDDETATAIRQLKLGVGVLLALGLWIGAWFVFDTAIGDQGYRAALACSGLYALGLTQVRYLFAKLQTDRQFYRYSLAIPVFGAVKLLFVAAAASLSVAPPYGFYAAFVLGSAVTFWIVSSLWKIPVRVPLRPSRYRAIVGYAKWIAGSTLLFLLMQRAEIFLIGALLSPAEVGRYGLALLLVAWVDYLTAAVKTVLLPYVTQASGREQARRMLLTVALVCTGILGALVIPYTYLDVILGLLVPEKAADVLPLVRPLLWAAAVSLCLDPPLLWLYRADRPVILTVANAVALALVVASNLWLLPRWGVEAAAYAHLLGRVVSRTIQVAYQGWVVATQRVAGAVA